MNEEEYLEKLVEDFGEINGYSSEEKNQFSTMLKKLMAINDMEGSFEEIIEIIIKQ
ncbi:hypothetical protein [Polaribacter sp. MED152]|uniref:hypothetical protein n=1 Tax=Polaribacter sp. MED152 TaxID=313598 RepID=UPI000068C869|nr:hypothetical protein [Polaribacter sp. MED152]EAQ42519.1 hypothetical protein MED152_07355 [Polaribacter sp. MED152]